MSRHYFAGANTPKGFFSHFDSILPLSDIKRKIYIKGGSGSGKSTLMKKTAEAFEKSGFTAEYFHCSNDAESLDGVNITERGIAVVDATSPHPADPQLPGVKDEIFNTAEFLDSAFLKENKANLSEWLTEKKALYQRAYSYLYAANEIYRMNERIYNSAINTKALNELILGVLRIFDSAKPSGAGNRNLFATAMTPDGVKSLVASALRAEKTYILNGFGAMGITELLESVQRYANLHGLSTISFKSPLNPAETEHLHIPALDTAFITSNCYHKFSGEGESVSFEELLNPTVLGSSKNEIEYNNGIFDELLKKSISTMTASKSVHAKIEEIYSEAMDFKRMNRAYDRILEEMLPNQCE